MTEEWDELRRYRYIAKRIGVIQSRVLYLFANYDVVLEVRYIAVRLEKMLEMEEEENVLCGGWRQEWCFKARMWTDGGPKEK